MTALMFAPGTRAHKTRVWYKELPARRAEFFWHFSAIFFPQKCPNLHIWPILGGGVGPAQSAGPNFSHCKEGCGAPPGPERWSNPLMSHQDTPGFGIKGTSRLKEGDTTAGKDELTPKKVKFSYRFSVLKRFSNFRKF